MTGSGGSPGGPGASAQRYSRVVEHAPAAVGVARAQAGAAAPILTAGLHGDSGELRQGNKGDSGQDFTEHSAGHQRGHSISRLP